MRVHYRFGVAVSAWTAAFGITVTATLNPSIAHIVCLWQTGALAIAVVSSVSLIANRAQTELVEDLQPPEDRLKSV